MSEASPITSDEIEIYLYRRNHPCDPMIPRFELDDWFECDFLTVTQALYSREFEIKLDRADFLKDFKKASSRYRRGHWRGKREKKHDRLANRDCVPNYFWFVTTEGIIREGELPPYAGHMIVTRSDDGVVYGKVVKEAPRLHRNKLEVWQVDKIYRCFSFRFWATELKYLDLKMKGKRKKPQLTKAERTRRRFFNRRSKIYGLEADIERMVDSIRRRLRPHTEYMKSQYWDIRSRETTRFLIGELREARAKLERVQELQTKDSKNMKERGIGRW